MKRTIKAVLMAVAFTACNNADQQKEAVNNGITYTIVDDSQINSSTLAKTTEEDNIAYQLDSSLIGKTTAEIEKYGPFNCAGTLLGSNESGGNLWVSHLAKSQKECRNGVGKILLQRVVGRNGDQAVFEILDEINIQSSYPEKDYNWTTCKVKGVDDEQFYVIHFKDQRQHELTEIYDLWAIDMSAGKFVKVKNAEGVTCVNPDYSGDL
ncbi:hypothetical protein [Pontibacter harenae]|uniref:hypothetical protein n=1 Tax=Pontibacter harenae TaxID=2894083 RepID=UPI001E616CAA|nr:hypothetical protein [Pontibacter harenae]MCC9167535.1 hypothetical protein [Pontibacter harenae]